MYFFFYSERNSDMNGRISGLSAAKLARFFFYILKSSVGVLRLFKIFRIFITSCILCYRSTETVEYGCISTNIDGVSL